MALHALTMSFDARPRTKAVYAIVLIFLQHSNSGGETRRIWCEDESYRIVYTTPFDLGQQTHLGSSLETVLISDGYGDRSGPTWEMNKVEHFNKKSNQLRQVHNQPGIIIDFSAATTFFDSNTITASLVTRFHLLTTRTVSVASGAQEIQAILRVPLSTGENFVYFYFLCLRRPAMLWSTYYPSESPFEAAVNERLSPVEMGPVSSARPSFLDSVLRMKIFNPDFDSSRFQKVIGSDIPLRPDMGVSDTVETPVPGLSVSVYHDADFSIFYLASNDSK